MRVRVAILILVASCASTRADLRSEGFRKLTGPQIRTAFAGHTFADDVHFSFRYARSGQIEGMGMGARVSRRWRVQKDELCETDKTDENCFSIWRKGDVVRFVVGDDGVFAEGTLK
jgi:hypothetical protein